MRQLSSQATAFCKFVLAPLWIGGFASATVVTAFSLESSRAFPFFAVATIVGGAFIYWSVVRLKRVQLDGNCLVVSNYFATVRIPLSDVSLMEGTVLISPELVFVSLRRPSRFGNKIVFMPPIRLFGRFTTHPIVAELYKLLESG